jgi:spermidine/putrescine transport system substrate-binding protein
MNKYYNLLIYSATSLLFLFVTFGQASANKELIFLNWSEYIDPDIVQQFEQRHKVKLHQIYFETDDTRDDLLLETDGKGYDLVLSAGSVLRTYKKQGWLAPITKQQVPNLKHINQKWLDAFADANGYAIPYFWGTTGIAYRKDLLGYDITSWKQLFEPNKKLSGKILMANSVNDVIGMALKSKNYSANSTNPEEYKQIEKLLMQQKPHVKAYAYMALNEESALVKGNVYASMAYSGDALFIKDIEPNIEYVLPEEGGNLWVDYIVVMQSSKNKQLAYEFINFLNEPEIAAQLAEFVYYASPNKAAEKLLDKEFLSDPIIYPDKQALQRSEFNQYLPARIRRMRNNIFNHVTQ